MTNRLEEALRGEKHALEQRDLVEKQLSAQLRKAERENFRIKGDLDRANDAKRNAEDEVERLRQVCDLCDVENRSIS